MNTQHQTPAALACPFCGSTDISDGEVLTETPDGKLFTQSMCRGCGALGPNGALQPGNPDYGDVEAITAWNRRLLAEPEQEPVYQLQNADGAWIDQAKHSHDYNVKHGNAKVRILYTSPQPREWQELSEDEALEAFNQSGTIVDTSPIEQYVICKFISAALRAKNEVKV